MAHDPSKFLFEALTYDDVLLVPAYSDVLPRETSTVGRNQKHIVIRKCFEEKFGRIVGHGK